MKNKQNFKKAFIDQIILWGLLVAITLGLVATYSDQEDARVTVHQLKHITDNAALSAGKYYMDVEENTNNAENTANNIIDEYNLSDSISVTYTWDLVSNPNTVTASVTSYEHSNFWFRFFNLDTFTLSAESVAELGSGEQQCACDTEPGVELTAEGILCVVGGDYYDDISISKDGNKWKVDAIFDKNDMGGGFEEQKDKKYRKNDVHKVYVILGNGDDYVQLGELNEETIVDGGCGNDYIEGSSNDETIYGNRGVDDIQGNDGDDIIYGGHDNDQIQAGSGTDIVYTDGYDYIQGAETTVSGETGYADDCSDPGSIRFDCTADGQVVLIR